MSNAMKFCGCEMCRRGMRASGSTEVRQTIRKFRRQAKQDLKQGREPEPKISVPYTD